MPGTNMNGTFARVYVIGLELGVGCMRCALAAVVVVISGISGTCFINQRFMAQISKMELPGNKHNLMGGQVLTSSKHIFSEVKHASKMVQLCYAATEFDHLQQDANKTVILEKKKK